ncbi:MAG: hypothetical protein IPO22_14820 [Anaerolineales bacterium]|nr:hypothetical protein [Anaerolineales bacterium]
MGNEYVFIQNAEKDIVGIWSAYLAGSIGYNPGEGNGTFEAERDPGTYLLWLDQIKGNWGIVGKVDGWERQVVPFEVYPGKITEVTLNLSVLEVGLTSNGSAVTDGFLNLYLPSVDAAGNSALGEEVAYSYPDNRGYASLVVAAGDYLLQWFAPGQCQYFDVSIPIGQTVKMTFDINNPGDCRN